MRNNIRSGKSGFLHVKLGIRSNSRYTWKGWRRKWVVAQGMFNLVTGQMGIKLMVCPEDHMPSCCEDGVNFEDVKRYHIDKITDRCSVYLLEDISKIKRTHSKTRGYAFCLEEIDGSVVLNLADETEFKSQQWILHLHSICWPPKSALELQKVFADLKEISIINATKHQDLLCGCVGFLSITNDGLTLVNPNTGDVVTEWPLKYIRRFTSLNQVCPEDNDKIFRMEIISRVEKYSVEIYSEDAEEILNNIESTIKQLMDKNKKKEKKHSRTEELSNLSVDTWESYYDTPKKESVEVGTLRDAYRQRNISIRLHSDSMSCQYDVLPTRQTKSETDQNANEQREVFSSVSSEESKSSSGSDAALDINNISDNSFDGVKTSLDGSLEEDTCTVPEIKTPTDEVDGGLVFDRIAKSGRRTSVYDTDNIYEDLDKYRKHRKDINKYLGITPEVNEDTTSPPLPPREYKLSTSSLPSPLSSTPGLPLPREYWFSEFKDLDVNDGNKQSFHSYIYDDVKSNGDSSPQSTSSPKPPRKTQRLKKRSSNSLLRLFNSEKSPSAHALSSSASCGNFEKFRGSNTLSPNWEEDSADLPKMRAARAGSDPGKMKMKHQQLTPPAQRSCLSVPVSPKRQPKQPEPEQTNTKIEKLKRPGVHKHKSLPSMKLENSEDFRPRAESERRTKPEDTYMAMNTVAGRGRANSDGMSGDVKVEAECESTYMAMTATSSPEVQMKYSIPKEELLACDDPRYLDEECCIKLSTKNKDNLQSIVQIASLQMKENDLAEDIYI